MQNSDEIVVPLGKLKIVLLIAISLIFVAGGVWLASLGAEQIQTFRILSITTLVYAIGYAAIAFFGLCGIYGITKLFDTKPGLILSSKGITDNSSAVAAGLIPWSEIIGFSEFQLQGTKMLIIHVQEPWRYVNRGNKMKRALNKANMGLVGSPIAISSTSLGISYPELIKLIECSFEQYGWGRPKKSL